MPSLRIPFGLLSLIVWLVAGCDSSGSASSEAPPPPPLEAFTMDTDLFAASPVGKVDGGEYAHFIYAASRVVPVSFVLGANLVVPAAVTAAALQVEPVREDGAWRWTSTARVDTSTVRFTLEAAARDDAVDYHMYVTTANARTGAVYDDFELYTARIRPDDRTGSWQLFQRVDGTRRAVLSAAFDVEEDVREITFSVPETAPSHAGDEVRYAVTEEEKTFVWTQAREDLQHRVSWDPATRQGSVVADGYNDGEPGCWNTAFRNTACPE